VTSLVQHVGVNHGRADIFVSHQFLNCADVVSGFQQVSGEGMPEGMAADRLDHSGFSNGLLDRPLKDPLMKLYDQPSSSPDLIRIGADGIIN
jgi:hypothetical protein